MNLLLAEQAEMDRRAFDRDSWTLEDWRDQKLGHILLHVTKAGGKLVRLKDHPGQLRPTPNMGVVGADLAVYRSQLVNLFELDAVAVMGRVVNVNSLRKVQDEVSAAAGSLSEYLEPLQHAPVEEQGQVLRAAQGLHLAAVGLSNMLGLDVEEIHRQRMIENITKFGTPA